MSSQPKSKTASGLRRFTFALSGELALDGEVIAHLQQLGQYRTNEALRRWALRAFQWRLSGLETGNPRPAAAPAWAGEAPVPGAVVKKRCWMYLSTRIAAEKKLSGCLDLIGPDRRAQLARDLVIDGFWLEKMSGREITVLQCTPESIACQMPQTPSRSPHTVDNVVQQINPQQNSQPHGASPYIDVHELTPAANLSDVRQSWQDETPAMVNPASQDQMVAHEPGAVNDPVVVQGAPMQRRERSSSSQASGLAALMGGAHFAKKPTETG